MADFEIKAVQSDGDIDAARGLFSAYANWLEEDHGISLTFQGIAEELAGLPGKYAPPKGQIYLAWSAERVALGCAAFRPFQADVCEIKRLYVAPDGRGQAMGRALIAATLKGAHRAGYTRAVLDTAGFMTGAQALYESFGFRDIPKYYENPVEGVRYMGADLSGR